MYVQSTLQHNYVKRTLIAVLLMILLSLAVSQAARATGPMSKRPWIARGEAATFTLETAMYHCRAIVQNLRYGATCRHKPSGWMKEHCTMRILAKSSCPRIFGIKGFGNIEWYTCDFLLWKKFYSATAWELKGKCRGGLQYQHVPAPR